MMWDLISMDINFNRTHDSVEVLSCFAVWGEGCLCDR